MERKQPKNAKPRQCLRCGKAFRPMTDKQWEWVQMVHNKASKRHLGL